MINPMSGKETHDIRKKTLQELIFPWLMPHFFFITLDLFSENTELALTMHSKLSYCYIFFLSENQEILERQWCTIQNSVDNGHIPLLHLNIRFLYVAGLEPMASAQLAYHALCSYLQTKAMGAVLLMSSKRLQNQISSFCKHLTCD